MSMSKKVTPNYTGITYYTQDGYMVRDREDSHLHAGVLEHLPHVLSTIDTGGRDFIVSHYTSDRYMGWCWLVETSKSDTVVYAKRRGREGYSRFVKHREPQLSKNMVVVLKKCRDESAYVIISSYIGTPSPAEPGNWRSHSKKAHPRQAYVQSKRYWMNHALILGSEDVEPNTKTSICRW
jgi:hypothetical protein